MAVVSSDLRDPCDLSHSALLNIILHLLALDLLHLTGLLFVTLQPEVIHGTTNRTPAGHMTRGVGSAVN